MMEPQEHWSDAEWAAYDQMIRDEAKARWPGRHIPELPVFCQGCGVEIESDRVFLIPESVYCVKCASQHQGNKNPDYRRQPSSQPTPEFNSPYLTRHRNGG